MPRPLRIRPAFTARFSLPLCALCLALAGQFMLSGRALVWVGAALLLAGGLLSGLSAYRAAARSCSASSDDGSAAGADDDAQRDPHTLVGGRVGLAAILFLVLLAAAFRLPWLGRLPPGLAADEARLGLDAANVLTSGWSASAWGGWPVFHLLTVWSVAALGHTPLAVRLPDALAGVLYAPALFLLGRQLGGTRLGMMTGLLGAVTFWHADATRAAWGYVSWGLTCEALALALLARAARRPEHTLTGFAGLTFGLALQVSWSALVVLGIGAVLFWSLLDPDQRSGRRLGAILAPFLVYFAVAAGPIAIGLCVPDRPTDLAGADSSGAVSLAGSPIGFWRLPLMFNVAGDPNPLHGLRGEAMLDAVTAALLVAGVGLALARWRSRSGLLVAWLVAALALVAVTGRGPQPDGLAALHALTPVLLLAASAVAVASTAPRHLGSATLPLDLALILLGAIVATNAHALFVRRPADVATWNAFGSAEALAAREMTPLVPTHTIYLADTWIDDPTIRFLAPGLTEPRRVDPTITFPLVEDDSFAFFGSGSQVIVPEDLERLYEDGEIDRFRSPLDDTQIVVRSFRATAKVVAGTRGVTLRATANDRARNSRYTLPDFAVDWPPEGESMRSASLELFSSVTVPAPGQYRLRLEGPPRTSLEVNGVKVAEAGQEVDVPLAAGSQRLRVVAFADGPSRIAVRWQPPGSSSFVSIPRNRLQREQRAASGLLALYREGVDPAAPAELARVERWLERDAQIPPVSRPYVVDWAGELDAPKSGTYRFQLPASGPASLWIDGRPVISSPSAQTTTTSIVLEEGDHRIQLRLLDEDGPTRFDLFWAAPGEDFEPVPTARFRPPDAAVDEVALLPSGSSAALKPLGAPRIRWLASTEGEPRAVAVQPDGDVLLANASAREIQRVEGEGRAIVSLPAALSVPSDVEIGPDGAVWALDALLGQVVRLDDAGTVTLTLDNRDLGLYRPRGFALAPDGTLLIADTGGNRVVRIATTGALLASIGPDVGGPEQVRQPTDVAVGPDGELFVVNGEGGSLLRLSPDGRYQLHWSVLPSDTERGAHLAIGPDRSLWVSEPAGRRVSRFTFDGAPAGVVDQTRAGRLLRLPVGIAVGTDGTLYVADASLRAVLALSFEP
ncbi:MAG: PA14 domain-containing protein [Chloroflexota bacterium]